MGNHRPLITPAEALRLLQAATPVLPAEEVPLAEAVGRVLAEPFAAPGDLPAFARAAMDGFAVRAADVAGASSTTPRELRVQGEVLAGGVAPEPLQPGGAYAIATGAALPEGADAVIRKEVASLIEGGRRVRVVRAVEPGKDVVAPATEAAAGEGLFPPGWVLGPNDLGLLAAFGVTHVPVVRRPRVAYVETGDELVPPGQALPPGHVYGSNGLVLSALAAEHGAQVVAVRRVGDDPAEMEACFRALLEEADVVVSTGGVSVGPRDWVPAIMEALGGRFLFQGLRMRPGRPVTAATVGPRLWLALSGNPAAALVNHELLVRPVLWRMAGLCFSQGFNPALGVPVDGVPPEPGGRPRYFLAHVRPSQNGLQARLDDKLMATGFAAPFLFNAVAEVAPRGSLHRSRGGGEGCLEVYPTQRSLALGMFTPFPWEVGGVLLAGGASRRMGHSKLLLPVDGVPLIVRAYRALRAVCAQVKVVGAPEAAVETLARWEGEGVRRDVVPDRWPGEGPLGGLITGLHHTPQPVALCLAADWINLDEGGLRRFLEAAHRALAASQIPAFALLDGEGRPQPLAALYPVARALEVAEELWQEGERAVSQLLKRLDPTGIPSDGRLVSVNTPEEYRQAVAGRGLGGRRQQPVVLAFAGHSGSGKTTLITALVRALAGRGVRVAVIKHGHGFDVDRPGKDSWRFRMAGAHSVVLASSGEVIHFSQTSGSPAGGLPLEPGPEPGPGWKPGSGGQAPRDGGSPKEEEPAARRPLPDLPLLLQRVEGEADVVLVEGFKGAPWPKILMLRDDEDYASHPLAGDPYIQAVCGGRLPAGAGTAAAGPGPVRGPAQDPGGGAGVPVFPRTGQGGEGPVLRWLLDWIYQRLAQPDP